MRQHVFFIGARACGKTTLGRELARVLDVPFVDTDEVLERQVGMPVSRYVERHGWEGFRQEETQALQSVAALPPQVVACGGGVVLRRVNREMLRRGWTCYLQVPAEELVRRLGLDPKESQRPSLTGQGLLEEVRGVLAGREALYLEAADRVLDGTRPLTELLNQLCRELAEPARD